VEKKSDNEAIARAFAIHFCPSVTCRRPIRPGITGQLYGIRDQHALMWVCDCRRAALIRPQGHLLAPGEAPPPLQLTVQWMPEPPPSSSNL
jgi:hypothetical protein